MSSKLDLGLEAQFASALRLEVARPAGDDLHDRFVGLAADAGHHLVARHLAQRLDLFAHRAGHAGQRHVAAVAELGRIHRRGMDQEADGSARDWHASGARPRRPAARPPGRPAVRG